MSQPPQKPQLPQQRSQTPQAPAHSTLPPSATSTTATSSTADNTITQVDRLVKRAQEGNAAALRQLHQAMSADPWLERQLSDLADITRQRIVDSILSPKNLLIRDILDRQIADLRRDLLTTARSPLERLLVERVLTCWTALYLAELSTSADDASTFVEQRIDRAHHRFLASIQALARVSRLLAPTIAQINIAASGAQQLNVAAPPRSEPDP